MKPTGSKKRASSAPAKAAKPIGRPAELVSQTLEKAQVVPSAKLISSTSSRSCL